MKIDFMFWAIMCLCMSVTANFVAFWYIRRVLARLLFINENLSDLSDYSLKSLKSLAHQTSDAPGD